MSRSLEPIESMDSGGVTGRRPLMALLLLVPAQSLGVAAMLFAFPGIEGKVLSGISRLWMLGFPLAWTLRVDRIRPGLAGPSRRGIILGIATGLFMFASIVTTYLAVAGRIDTDALVARARSTGFDRPALFAAIMVYIVLLNSILEEFVWRWFVARQVDALLPQTRGRIARAAQTVTITAILFTIHHVIALSAWVGPSLVILGSLGVFAAGLIWSALYARERSLWPCMLSHILADLAILVIAYDLLFRSVG